MQKFKEKLDMVPGEAPTVVKVSQYDDDIKIEFELYSHAGTLVIESGTTAAVRGTKPDGNGISVDVDLTSTTDQDTGIATWVASFDIIKQMTAIAGKSTYELTLIYGEKELNSANFVLDIERAALDMDTPTSNSVLREFVEVNDDYQSIVDAAATATSAAETAAQANTDAQAAKTAAQSSAESASGSAQTASNAVAAVTDARDEAISQIEERAQQIARLTTNAQNIAANAAQRVNEIENSYATTESRIQALSQIMEELRSNQAMFVTNGYAENEYAHFENMDGDRLFSFTGVGGGSGSGSGSGSATTAQMVFNNTSGWRAYTVPANAACPFSFEWSSVDNGVATGPGILKILAGSTATAPVLTSQEIQQGANTIDLAPYCQAGTNARRVQVEDVDGQIRYANLTITVAAVSLSSTYDASDPVDGAFTITVTPVGENLQKTIYYEVDGQLDGTTVTSVSGRQVSYMVPAQSHGAHSLRIWFECTINNQTVRSNELYYEFISLEPLNNSKIIASSFNQATAQQYSLIPFTWTVIDPANLETTVSLYANNSLITTLTCDRTEQSYPYRANTAGALDFRIQAGSESKTLTVTVAATQIDVEAETESLALNLNALGRSNSEAHPEVWQDASNNVSATLTGFNFTSDGWITDADGAKCLRVTGDARVTIPFQIFASDPRPGGLTVSVDFATCDVMDYTTPVISCMQGSRGIQITPETATLRSNESSMAMQYEEDAHLRVDFVIGKRANSRIIRAFMDGVRCGSVQYPDGDVFVQESPVGISIGSNNATVDIYNIRVYTNDLSADQIVDNWIADTQDGALMLERYTRNNIMDAGKISISKLPANIPYMIIRVPSLPQYKGDKQTAVVTFIDPLHPARSFITRCQIDVQGTSSAVYPLKNYKTKSSEGFESVATGSTSAKWAMGDDAIPAKTFTHKKNFASSEGANNTLLAMLFNAANPYRTPAQVANGKVRQSIEGFPMVVFWDDGESQEFIGKYTFNNDKGTEEVFGYSGTDEVWELKNNTSLRCLCKKAGFSEMGVDSDGFTVLDWLNDFEARYPDTDPAYEDGTQLEAFLTWIMSTDSTQATDDPLDAPVTYTSYVTTYVQVTDPETGQVDYVEALTPQDVTYTTDSAAYRVAKFRDEAPDYIEMEALHFYANFCEVLLGVDSLAKNNMWGFIGTEINNGEGGAA